MNLQKISLIFSALLVLMACASLVVAQETGEPDTHEVFGRYASRIVKIHVVENSSGAKATIGSGFHVSKAGHIITNYHVISKIVHHGDRYSAEFIDSGGGSHPLKILNIDVINDLAVVQSDYLAKDYFNLSVIDISQGRRLYALGYPHDIGISIVEGTYNGLLEHALYKKIHFTSSINPGMSGGPSITSLGEVVGINVSTAGNQVSFLVPVEAAVRLYKDTLSTPDNLLENFLEIVRNQLYAHQEAYLYEGMMSSGQKVRLGDFMLPSRLAPYFKCWGDSQQTEKSTYSVINHRCSTDDYLFVSGSQRSGIIEIHHRLITSEELNSMAFYELYSTFYAQNTSQLHGSEEEVTSFRCESENVISNDIPFKVAFCIRRYRKLQGLYDMVLRAAALGLKDTGLDTTLVLAGVSFEKAGEMARTYLEAVSWAE